jgi:hypothetical protein
MALIQHVAIISLTRHIRMTTVLQVSAAVQKQVSRDFTPIWGIAATVDPFADLGSVPSDYHHVVIFGEPDELVDRLAPTVGEERAIALAMTFRSGGVTGLHLNGITRQPFALVRASETWAVTVSHEVLEMLADPYGNHLIAAKHPIDPAKRVDFLLEVCDPCQAIWYPVNGVPVSDFYTPRYFDPVRVESMRYSFTGELTEPLQILEDGYLSWIDSEDSGLYQLAGDAPAPRRIADIAALAAGAAPLRTVVDTDPRTPRITSQALRPASSAMAGTSSTEAVLAASRTSALRTVEAVASVAAGL